MNIIGSVLESLKTLKVTLTITPFAGKTKRELNSGFGNWKGILAHNWIRYKCFEIREFQYKGVVAQLASA